MGLFRGENIISDITTLLLVVAVVVLSVCLWVTVK